MSNQIITFKKKRPPSDATRAQRRRTQKRRQQTARQQRWTDACGMIRAIVSNILTEDEDQVIADELNEFCKRTARRLKPKQSDEQIVYRAIRHGCWTIEDIQDETGFTKKFIQEQLAALQSGGKIVRTKDNLYRTA